MMLVITLSIILFWIASNLPANRREPSLQLRNLQISLYTECTATGSLSIQFNLIHNLYAFSPEVSYSTVFPLLFDK
jgi:hypothetical protein